MKMFEHNVLGVYNRTLSSKPWSPPGVSLIAARRIWPSTRGENTVVAILDTGIDYRHPDLKYNIIGGISFVPEEKDHLDLNGHGTHVAGTIGANGRLLGVGPQCKLLAVKVLDRHGAGSYQGIIKGLEYVRRWKGPAGEKVNVINMSLGGPQDNENLHREVKKVMEAGITIVAAAGNEGDGRADTPEISYPAYYKEVVAVGAINLQSGIANFSNSNDRIAIVAPGVETYSTFPGGKYVKLSGTSMAAPHISGAVALIYSRWQKRFKAYPSPREVKMLLHYAGIDLGETGFDNLYGYGLFSFNPDGAREIRLFNDSKQYLLNGLSKELSAPVIQNNSISFGPLQEIADLLGTDANLLMEADELGDSKGGVEMYV